MKLIAVVFTAAAIAASTSAFAQQLPSSAQERHPIAERNVPAPLSPAHQQAMVSGIPNQCGGTVEKFRDNVGLRIQQPEPGASTRLAQNADLQAAADFSRAGDEEGCWYWYDRAMQVVR